MNGYADPAYGRSLESWGKPLALMGSSGTVLVRDIPGQDACDAMGPYPIFSCREWKALPEDLAALSGPVTLTLVTDPFGDYDEPLLHRAFPDKCVRFKEHHILDLQAPTVSRHHRRNAEAALRIIYVRVASEPVAELDTWLRLYQCLIDRHNIMGPLRFSREIFQRQLCVPGMQVLIAEHEGEPIGMTLWLDAGDVCYYHLGAYTPLGYERKASFALFATAIEIFRPRARWLSFGAGPGGAATDDGLSRFKRGWSSTTRTAYLCGRILDRPRYAALVANVAPTSYFPAYRAGEFA